MTTSHAADFAAIAITLYAAHHVGDYWVQTDHQAAHKGLPGRAGRLHCLAHVATYTATQAALTAAAVLLLSIQVSGVGVGVATLITAGTHYLADRREYGIMFRLARLIPGKDRFLLLGVPRAGREDNPSLGTGAWALDQSWHIFWGVFVAGLALALL